MCDITTKFFLGKLVKVERAARTGRNPATGATIQIPAKTVLKFKIAKAAKDAIPISVVNLRSAVRSVEAQELERSLLDRIDVRPEGKGWEVGLIGAIAEMIKLATNTEAFVREPLRSSVKVVAGVGFEPTTFRL